MAKDVRRLNAKPCSNHMSSLSHRTPTLPALLTLSRWQSTMVTVSVCKKILSAMPIRSIPKLLVTVKMAERMPNSMRISPKMARFWTTIHLLKKRFSLKVLVCISLTCVPSTRSQLFHSKTNSQCFHQTNRILQTITLYMSRALPWKRQNSARCNEDPLMLSCSYKSVKLLGYLHQLRTSFLSIKVAHCLALTRSFLQVALGPMRLSGFASVDHCLEDQLKEP